MDMAKLPTASQRCGIVRSLLALILVGSFLTSVAAIPPFPLRGDTNTSGTRDLSDAIYLLNYLFSGGPAPECGPAANINGQGAKPDLSDAIFLLNYLFSGGTPPPAFDEVKEFPGKTVAETPDPNGLPYACSHCHALVPQADSPILFPGSTLDDAIRRQSWKNGHSTTFLEATNVCRVDWMLSTPYTATDPDFVNLVNWLRCRSKPNAVVPMTSITIVLPAVDGPPTTGNVAKGCALFAKACAICHGNLGQGIDPLGPSLMDPALARDDNPNEIRKRIRLSGPDNPDSVYNSAMPPGTHLLGTLMPFFTIEVLSDADVEDLTAYVLAGRQHVKDNPGSLGLACSQ